MARRARRTVLTKPSARRPRMNGSARVPSASQRWLLTAASAALATSSSEVATLERIARLALPVLADYCIVELAREDGDLELVVAAHVDPAKERLLHELRGRYPPGTTMPTSAQQVIRSGQAELYMELNDAVPKAGVEDAELLRLLRELGPRSSMLVPLIARGRTIGAISFVAAESRRRYTRADLATAEDLASRAALAIDHARLHHEIEQQARRAQALAVAAQAFAEASLDLPAILDRVTRQVAELIGDFCAIRLLSDDREWLVTVAQYHPNPAAHALVEAVHAIPYRADEGFMGQVVQTGQALRIPVLRPDEARAGLNPALWQYLDRIGLHSLLMVPLYVRGQVIGAVGATRSTPGRPYTAEDQVFLQDLADRAALAIDHARLYAAERRAREQAERAAERAGQLLAITAALSASLTPPQVAEVVLHQGIAAMGAYAGSIVLRSDDNTTLEIVGMIGYPPQVVEAWHTFPADLPIPIADSTRNGEAIWCSSREALAERYPHTLTDLIERTAAIASLPLLVDRRPIGALGLSFTEPQAFTVEDRTFMLALAQQCAQALDRARLYEAERRAHAEVQEAVRIRDIFLSIASHELRTPLTSLLGNVQLIQRRAAREGQLGERDRRALGVIESQAARLNAMVNALLDISRIETGQLSIARAPLDLGVLVREVVEEVQPTLSRQHTIRCTIPEAPLFVDGDVVRLEQVLQNLIGNAVKYSPAGGAIEVRVERHAGSACVAIRDEGIGIPRAAIPHLFQRFYRATNADDQHISGMGIGLYVVKEILTLHGGTVAVESAEHAGSTFRICLPLL